MKVGQGRIVKAEGLASATRVPIQIDDQTLPRGQIVNRSTLIKEVETDAASLLDQLSDLDDLILQFDGTDAGKRFIEAWKRARTIVDAGHGHSTDDPAPAPAVAPKP